MRVFFSKEKGLSIRSKITLSFCALLVLLVLIAIQSIYRLGEAKDKIEKIISENYATTALGNDIVQDVYRTSSLLLNSVITTDSDKRDIIISELISKSKEIEGLYTKLSLTANDDKSQKLLKNIAENRAYYVKSRERVIKKINNNTDAAINEYTSQTRGYEKNYIESINDFITLQRDEMKDSYGEFLDDYNKSKIVMTIIALICTLSGIGMSVLMSGAIVRPIQHAVDAATRIAKGDLATDIHITTKDETGVLTGAISHMQDELRKIVDEIRNGAENIATGASQIMAGTRDLSARTEEQASSVEQTASSMEQISSTVKNTGDNTAKASQLSGKASEAVQDNGKLMSELTLEIQNISTSAEKMADIINLIDSIAFQTNILALNAAVEAARAGEHGKGFAVVAQEVRNLAQKTANSSKDIRHLIDNSTQQSVRGLEMVSQVNMKMSEMVKDVDSVASILNEIEQASIEQSDGVNQINIAIGQIDTTTQQNAALVEESVAASEMLNEQANAMKELVSVFRIPGQLQS